LQKRLVEFLLHFSTPEIPMHVLKQKYIVLTITKNENIETGKG
jgi:hypothetical protein